MAILQHYAGIEDHDEDNADGEVQVWRRNDWILKVTTEASILRTHLGWCLNTCSKVRFKYSGRLEQMIRRIVSNPSLLDVATSFKVERERDNATFSDSAVIFLEFTAASTSESNAVFWSWSPGLSPLLASCFMTATPPSSTFPRKNASSDSWNVIVEGV